MIGLTQYMKPRFFTDKQIGPFNLQRIVTIFSLWLYSIGGVYYFVSEANAEHATFNWQSIALIFLCAVLLGGLGVRVISTIVKKQSFESTDWQLLYRNCFNVVIVSAFCVTILIGIKFTGLSFRELVDVDGINGALRIFSALFTPNMEILGKAISASIETVFMAFIATSLAIPAAFALSLLCSNNIVGDSILGKSTYYFLRSILNISRSIEPLVWAIIFSVWVGIGPLAGVLALSLHSVCSLVKVFSEQIEIVGKGPMEAMISVGANKLQVIFIGLVPQAIPALISLAIYRMDINLRMATIIGLVGGGGIGTMLIQYQGLGKWHEVGTIVGVIAFVVCSMDYLSARLRKSLI